MANLTLKHLRYFDALARQQHFGRAAAACFISQPALSLQIKELEEIVGAPLVERSAKNVHLTPLGQDFLERARPILLEVKDLEDVMRGAQGPLAGQLRLGVIPTIAPYLLPEVITAVSQKFPELEMTLRESVTRSLIDDLLDLKLDLAIVALPISEPSLVEQPIFDEDFVLVRSPEDAEKPVPKPDSLQTLRLLLLEEGHCFRDQALSFCKVTDAQPRQVMEGSSLSTLVRMVSAGMGVTLIPEMALDLETRFANVSVARFAKPSPSRTIGMVWRKSNPLSHQLTQIGDIVSDVWKVRQSSQTD